MFRWVALAGLGIALLSGCGSKGVDQSKLVGNWLLVKSNGAVVNEGLSTVTTYKAALDFTTLTVRTPHNSVASGTYSIEGSALTQRLTTGEVLRALIVELSDARFSLKIEEGGSTEEYEFRRLSDAERDLIFTRN